MKKWFVSSVIIFVCFTLCIQSTAHAEEKTFNIEQVTIHVVVDEEGIMHVSELSTYTFDGVFGGTERSILADVSNFYAYEVSTDVDDPTISIDELDELHVEEEEDLYRVHIPAEDEQKQLLYSYEIANEIDKYTDVADLIYDFYPSSNPVDLGKLTIHWEFEQALPEEEINAFVRGDDEATVDVTDTGVVYTHESFTSGMSAEVRLIFPATAVDALPLKSDVLMGEKLIQEEQMMMEKRELYVERLTFVQPVIYVALLLLIAGFIWWYRIHPNYYRFANYDDLEKELIFLERTDPLFVSFIQASGYVSVLQSGLVAALLSLKRRNIISMKEVQSKKNEEKMTYAFIWKKKKADVDEVDAYLRTWLFEETDEEKEQFMFETILIDEDESETVKEEKSEQFKNHYEEWTQLLKKREAFTGWHEPYPVFGYVSILMTMIVYALFSYVLSITPISSVLQLSLIGGIGVFVLAALIWNKNKWVLSLLYIVLLPTFLIASTWSIYLIPMALFTGASWFGLLVISARKWAPEVAKLYRMILMATRLFKRKEYPVDNDEMINERRLETAIALGVGKQYAEQIGKHIEIANWNTANTPLLHNPTIAGTVFHPSHMVFYSAMSSSTSSTTSSSSPTSGSGGAGAF